MSAWAWECGSDKSFAVTYPRSGVSTYGDAISLRGFICHNFPIIVVKNVTTDKSVLTETKEICESGRCVYPFAVFVEDLAMGKNDLQATVPGREPPLEIHVEVVRTALAQKDKK